MKDITTGALRRKRGAGDDLDISDEEDAFARRREAKRREFARMRRELLKDEAVGKIADDQKKAAFFKSIEDRDEMEDENSEVQEEEADTQSQPQDKRDPPNPSHQTRKPLEPVSADVTNRPLRPRRTDAKFALPSTIHRPSTLAEIRAQVSFLIEDPDSQSHTPDQGSSDIEDEAHPPEAYVDLDRHLHQAEVDENANADDVDADNGLADFIVDDEPSKPTSAGLSLARAPAHERRTRSVRTDVIDRLSLARQGSGSSLASETSTIGLKPAFIAPSSKSASSSGVFRVPTLLRRATTNSSLSSSLASLSTSTISATGVTTSNSSSNTTERGAAEDEKEKFRKAAGGRRNAVNFYTKGRVEERERERERSKVGVREGKVAKGAKGKKGGKAGKAGKAAGFLGGLFRSESWE